MPDTPKDLVDAHLANSGLNPNSRSPTPKPTTESGVELGHALYDTPDKGSQAAEFRTGRRKRRSTQRGEHWVEVFKRSEDIRKKGNRTQKVNGARRTHESSRDNSSQGRSHSQFNPTPASTAQPEPKVLPRTKRRGRSKTARQISRSPKPGSTDQEGQNTTCPPTSDSQFTFVYETLDHDGLVQYAHENHGINGHDCSTQTLLTKIRVAQKQQAPQVGPPRQPPSIQPLPRSPLQVSGGWHLEFPASYRPESSGLKQGVNVSQSSGLSKRLRLATDQWDDTATEPETDEDPSEYRLRNAVKNIMGPYPSGSHNQRPNPSHPSAPGIHAPPPSQEYTPPSRESTPTTVAASPPPCSLIGKPSCSHYGKSTTPTSPIPQIPNLLVPPHHPVHARLRGELLERYINCVGPDEDAADAGASLAVATDKEIDQLSATDNEAVPEARSGPQRTYNRTRTHLSHQPQTSPPEPNDAAGPAPSPSSPSLDCSHPAQAKRTQPVVTKTLADVRKGMQGQRALLGKSTTPLTCSQPRPPPGASGDALSARAQGSRRLDPVSNARTDMILFNEAVARREATSFVQSATHQSKRTAHCAAPASRPPHELLDDDEELLAEAEAFAKKKWPESLTQSRGRKRKQKPLARDVSGILWQILILAKIHLFAYALVQGVYQTRATFLRWAESVHFATWQMELPTTPFECPHYDHFEIMVNSIATLRGKVKERLHPFTAITAGFQHCTTNQEVIQENLRKFNLVYPNSFHCKSYSPRKGHYKSPEVAHCIAAALFHGPGSVGVMFPDYFIDMPLTVVAFALAIWQFCIEEWSNGWHQNGDLGMAAMREKYEAQLAGLKQLRDVAPKRMEKLQTQWCEYVVEYSGAMLTDSDNVSSEGAYHSEMRPDTPELETEEEAQAKALALAESLTQMQAKNRISVEEMNARLLETGRQASLQKLAQEIAAREEMEIEPDTAMDEDDDAEPHTPTLPPIEYNSQGRLTASSKGKASAL